MSEQKRRDPTYHEFFCFHPVGTNKKQVLLDYTDSENVHQQLCVTITWQGMQPVYIHCTSAFDRREIYVGVYDGFNTTIWPTPQSLGCTAEMFKVIKRWIRSYGLGREKEFFTVTYLE